MAADPDEALHEALTREVLCQAELIQQAAALKSLCLSTLRNVKIHLYKLRSSLDSRLTALEDGELGPMSGSPTGSTPDAGASMPTGKKHSPAAAAAAKADSSWPSLVGDSMELFGDDADLFADDEGDAALFGSSIDSPPAGAKASGDDDGDLFRLSDSFSSPRAEGGKAAPSAAASSARASAGATIAAAVQRNKETKKKAAEQQPLPALRITVEQARARRQQMATAASIVAAVCEDMDASLFDWFPVAMAKLTDFPITLKRDNIDLRPPNTLREAAPTEAEQAAVAAAAASLQLHDVRDVRFMWLAEKLASVALPAGCSRAADGSLVDADGQAMEEHPAAPLFRGMYRSLRGVEQVLVEAKLRPQLRAEAEASAALRLEMSAVGRPAPPAAAPASSSSSASASAVEVHRRSPPTRKARRPASAAPMRRSPPKRRRPRSAHPSSRRRRQDGSRAGAPYLFSASKHMRHHSPVHRRAARVREEREEWQDPTATAGSAEVAAAMAAAAAGAAVEEAEASRTRGAGAAARSRKTRPASAPRVRRCDCGRLQRVGGYCECGRRVREGRQRKPSFLERPRPRSAYSRQYS